MKPSIAAAAAAILAAIFFFADEIGQRFGYPPYASADEVSYIAQQLDVVAGNTLLIEIRMAAASGNMQLLRHLCAIFQRQNGWSPKECQ